MIGKDQVQQLVGETMTDESGDKVGKIGMVYLDDQTGEPAWATVNTGFFGSSESFVPLDGADLSGEGLRVPYGKAMIKDAPNVADDGHISPAEEEELYRYYGLDGAGYASDTRTPTDRAPVGHDTSGPTTDDAMTRSEEHLNVGTQRREAGRARLRKYVVTEQQTVNVPVTREEVRVEREPITDANVDRAVAGPAISEEEHEVVLHEEVPVVSKEARPVERVRLDTETVTDTERVTDEVRKEHIEADGDVDLRGERSTAGHDRS